MKLKTKNGKNGKEKKSSLTFHEISNDGLLSATHFPT